VTESQNFGFSWCESEYSFWFSHDISVRRYVMMLIPFSLTAVCNWLLSIPPRSSSLQTPLYCPSTLPHCRKQT